ncbi:Uncharacterized protein TCM_042106 [Theobroma cacao]|uniref:Uncharacterized protein n=1 Tax=Theobroma cacao TaxID=3641 RepID=A0A061GYS2_THECC|nr:Uncharacterized protein TCM_042106 [Theobroma cacao]
MMAAQEILELFCELIFVHLPIIETQEFCNAGRWAMSTLHQILVEEWGRTFVQGVWRANGEITTSIPIHQRRCSFTSQGKDSPSSRACKFWVFRNCICSSIILNFCKYIVNGS